VIGDDELLGIYSASTGPTGQGKHGDEIDDQREHDYSGRKLQRDPAGPTPARRRAPCCEGG